MPQELSDLEVWQLGRDKNTIPLAVTAGFVDDLLKNMERDTELAADARTYIVEKLIPVLVPGTSTGYLVENPMWLTVGW